MRGELFLDGVSINELLLKDGFAWASRDSFSDGLWLGLERLARKQSFGLWRNDQPMPPWKFRDNVAAGI
jgi:endonuclease YncB( thermonuclease family)